jgi:hypothetical protein
LIRLSAPDSLSIPEPRNRSQLQVFKKLYERHPLLGDERKGWTVSLIQELNRTSDSDLFRSDGKGWPLIEGKHFHQFIPDYDKPDFTVNPTEGLQRTAKHREYENANRWLHEAARLAFRDVAASTNVRSMVSCIIPPRSFCSNKAIVVLPKVNAELVRNSTYHRTLSYFLGVFNSFVFDFLIRARITMSLNFFYVYQTPVPANYTGGLAREIVRLAARLSAHDDRFRDFARDVGVDCGPLSMSERIDLTAKLNALVARHYGLSLEEFKTITDSFEGFEEGKGLEKLEEVEWNDNLIRKFNWEVRQRALAYFEKTVEAEVQA